MREALREPCWIEWDFVKEQVSRTARELLAHRPGARIVFESTVDAGLIFYGSDFD